MTPRRFRTGTPGSAAGSLQPLEVTAIKEISRTNSVFFIFQDFHVTKNQVNEQIKQLFTTNKNIYFYTGIKKKRIFL